MRNFRKPTTILATVLVISLLGNLSLGGWLLHRSELSFDSDCPDPRFLDDARFQNYVMDCILKSHMSEREFLSLVGYSIYIHPALQLKQDVRTTRKQLIEVLQSPDFSLAKLDIAFTENREAELAYRGFMEAYIASGAEMISAEGHAELLSAYANRFGYKR